VIVLVTLPTHHKSERVYSVVCLGGGGGGGGGKDWGASHRVEPWVVLFNTNMVISSIIKEMKKIT
jgi:hypothetical protein